MGRLVVMRVVCPLALVLLVAFFLPPLASSDPVTLECGHDGALEVRTFAFRAFAACGLGGVGGGGGGGGGDPEEPVYDCYAAVGETCSVECSPTYDWGYLTVDVTKQSGPSSSYVRAEATGCGAGSISTTDSSTDGYGTYSYRQTSPGSGRAACTVTSVGGADGAGGCVTKTNQWDPNDYHGCECNP